MNRLYRYLTVANWPHAALLGVCLVIGIALGMTYADVGATAFLKVMDGSTWPELFAAIGTWVIGFLVWMLTVRSHEHDRRVTLGNELREQRRELNTLIRISNELVALRAAAHAVMNTRGTDYDSISQAKMGIDTAFQFSKSITLTQDWAMLRQADIDAIQMLLGDRVAFEVCCAHVLRSLAMEDEENSNELADFQIAWLDTASDTAKELYEAAGAVRDLVGEVKEQYEKRVAALDFECGNLMWPHQNSPTPVR